MDIGKVLSDSLEYAKDAVWGKWVRWLLLLISTIIFPLILGYELEVYRGKKPAPEPDNWGKLFIDGIKLFIIELIYAIPVFIVLLVFGAAGALSLVSGSPTGMLAAWGTFATGILVMIIVAIIIGLVEAMGVVRFARMGRMEEAFNFSAILDQIGKIGWGSYILALIVMFIVVAIIAFILSFIPIIGLFLVLIAAPALAIFSARYICLIYDSATPAAPPATSPAA